MTHEEKRDRLRNILTGAFPKHCSGCSTWRCLDGVPGQPVELRVPGDELLDRIIADMASWGEA